MKKTILVSLVLVAVAAVVFFASGGLSRPDKPVAQIEGAEWVEALSWDFADGLYPEGWGWGGRRLADGTLQLGDPSGNPAVYFLPVSHGSDFVLETEVALLHGADGRKAGAHLTTRDTGFTFNVSGMAVFAEGRPAYFKHTINKVDVAAAFVDTAPEIEYGTWHSMRLVMRRGVLSGYLDNREIYAKRSQRGGPTYTEPHLAVEDGVARFRYLKVYSAPGFRGRVAGIVASMMAAADEVPIDTATLIASLPEAQRPWWIRLMLYVFYGVIFLVCVYMARHYTFTLNRLFGSQRHPYLDVDIADWPKVTVLVPAHNEEPVVGTILQALIEVDYPTSRLRILPINDRSEDKTGEIIDAFAARHPRIVKPYHRTEGKAGKAAALRDAMERVEDDIVLVFDADYIPGHGIIKQLVAPFFDPEVGAVMGRVVPHNVARNLLTRALDLERAGGYQVDQQARMNLHLLPQYGGTVGGVRKRALQSVGGWNADSLTEDTDVTFQLILGGWKIVYQNRSECYEQVPETWPMRTRQLRRWAQGHNAAMAKYSRHLLFNRFTSFREKLDGLLLLHVYVMSALLLLGWMLGIVLWFLGVNRPGLIIILAVTSYSTLGNFAVFFEVAAAAYLDGSRERLRLLPFILLGFLVSLVTVTRVTLTQMLYRPRGQDILWHKTEHNHTRPTWT